MMQRLTAIALIILTICCSGVFISRTKGRTSPRKSGALALLGAKIYPSPDELPITNGVVIIENGRITTVGEKAKIKIPNHTRVIDCTGLTLTSGFWNSHVHLSRGTPANDHADISWLNAAAPAEELTRELREMLTQYGFTTVFDVGSVLDNTNAIRRRIDGGEVKGPRILTTGMLIFPKDASPHAIGQYLDMKFPEVEAPDQAKKIVREIIGNGANGIKIHVIGPTADNKIKVMPLELVKAITDEAHREGKLVFVHPGTPQGWQAAIDAGVDIFTHSNPNPGAYTEAQIAALVKNNRAVTPTLTLFRYDTIREGTPNIALQVQMQAVDWLRAYLKAGGQVLFGTDVGYIQEYDTAEEYQQMARAGMDYRQILASLTTTPAARFGASKQVGKVAVGMEADIVLLNADPATDVRAFSKVRMTMRRGQFIYGQPGN